MTSKQLLRSYLNFDLDISGAGDHYLARVLASPQGEDSIEFSLAFSESQLENSLILVGGQVRKASSSAQTLEDNALPDAPLPLRDPRSFGKSLFDIVFAGKVGDLFLRNLDEAKRRKAGLRIRLRLNHAPELAALPWEYLYDSRRRRYLCRSAQTPLVRYLELPEEQHPLLASLPLRILVVLSDPIDVPLKLEVEAEWTRMKQAFADLEKNKRVKLERLERATVSELRRFFQREQNIHVVHFIGHGGFDYQQSSGGLLLEDDSGKGVFVSAETLCDILGDHPPRLVFLNACEGAKASLFKLFSGVGQQLVQQGTPAVIAMQFMISDGVAVNLAQEFYTALAEGHPVDAALAEARKEISSEGSLMEWGTPVLFMRSPDGYLFDIKEWLPTPPCPYPGMIPFGQSNAASDPFIDKFYGRTQEIEEAIHQLRNHSFVAILGPSGVGKSSLVFAGLLPRLHHSTLDDGSQWTIASMRPGETPLQTLADRLNVSPAELQEHSQTIHITSGNRLLLVVDQFEELFTLSENSEANSFQNVLNQLFQDKKICIVLTVRADFYQELAASPLWERIKAHRLELRTLDAAALRAAIVKPADDVDVEIDPALVERILADAADEPGAMPLIQETLVLLWSKVRRRHLALEAYTHLTHKYVGRTGIQVALALRADTTYGELSKLAQLFACRSLLRMVQFGEGRSDTRRQEWLSALQVGNDDQTLFEQTIQSLATSRLLTITADETNKQRRVDIAHEALIIGWPTFQGWLKQYRQGELTRRSFEAKAAQWREHKRKGALLNELLTKEAKEWIGSEQAKELGCSQDLIKLTAASHRAFLFQRVILWLSIVTTLAVLLFALRLFAMSEEDERIESRKVAKSAMQQLLSEPMSALGTALTRLPRPTNRLPMIPEIQAALFQSLHTPLETFYQDLSPLLVTGSMLTDAQIQPGRNWLAIGGTQLALLNLTSGENVTLTTPSEPLVAVQWDQTGTKLLGWSEHQISAWQEDTLLASQSFGDETIDCVQWRSAPTGSAEVAVCTGTTIRLWSPAEQTLSKLTALPLEVAGLSWSPDGRWLVAWDDSRAVKAEAQSIFIWDSQQHYRLITITTDGANPIQSVVWSPTSHDFVAPQFRKDALHWNAEAGTEVAPIHHADKIDGVAFVDEAHFLSWSNKDVTRLWPLDGAQERQYGIAEDRIQSVVPMLQQREFLTFLSNGSAYQWNIDSGERTHTFCCHDKPIRSVSWRDDNYLATEGKDGTVRIWQVAPFEPAGKELLTLHVSKANDTSGRADVLGTIWLNDHDLLAYGQDAKLRRWQIFDEHDQPICSGIDARKLPICHHFSQTIPGIQGNVSQLQWVDDKTLVTASAADANLVTVTQPMTETHGFTTSTPSLLFWSLEGRYLLRAIGEQSAQVEEIKSEQTVMTFSQPISTVLAIEGGFLISGVDGQVTLLQPGNNQSTLLQGALYSVTAAAVAQDGRLATANQWGVIQIWSLPEGREQMRLGDKFTLEEQLPIYELQWSADSKSLFSASRLVMRWDLTTQTGIRLLKDAGFKVHIALGTDEHLLAVAIGPRFFVIDAEGKQSEPLWTNSDHDQTVMGVRWVEAAQWPNQYRYGAAISRLGSWLIGREINEGTNYTLLMTWSGDGTVRFWDWKNEAEVMRISEPGPIVAAAINPSVSQIATVSLSPIGDPAPPHIWQTWLNAPNALLTTAQSQLISE